MIKNDAPQSKPWWAPGVVPPRGRAPNVLLIITNDAGFGLPSTFGVIPTPTTDRIANDSLRYNPGLLDRPLFADTRRVDHGTQPPPCRIGVILEQWTDFPGSIIGKDDPHRLDSGNHSVTPLVFWRWPQNSRRVVG